MPQQQLTYCIKLLVCCMLLAIGCSAFTAVSAKLPLPRFVSLRSDKANVRVGPGRQYPIQWVLVRRYLPLEIIAEFDTWRKIKDPEGEVIGWIHQSLLAGLRTGIVQGTTRSLHREPSLKSFTTAQLEPGVITKIFKCKEAWCRVQVGPADGWIERKDLWGVYPNELVK